MRTDADQIVNQKPDGTLVTMQKLFDELGLSAYDLNIDVLDVHAGYFSAVYNLVNLLCKSIKNISNQNLH